MIKSFVNKVILNPSTKLGGIFIFLIFSLFLIVTSVSAKENLNMGNKSIVVKGCEEFKINGQIKDTVILLLHGLGGCPHEVRELGHFLNSKGYTVSGIRYPGHGEKGQTMSNFGWKDWYEEVKKEYLTLKSEYKTVYVAGFSTGGTLALKLAENFEIDKLILLSPFIHLTHKWYYILTPEMYLNSVGKLVDGIPTTMSRINLNDPKAKKEYIKGEYFSFKATRSALELIEEVKKDISKVISPTLLIHSKNDETTDYKSSEYILKNISSKEKELIYLEKSNHIITLDYDKNFVYDKVFEYIKK